MQEAECGGEGGGGAGGEDEGTGLHEVSIHALVLLVFLTFQPATSQ